MFGVLLIVCLSLIVLWYTLTRPILGYKLPGGSSASSASADPLPHAADAETVAGWQSQWPGLYTAAESQGAGPACLCASGFYAKSTNPALSCAMCNHVGALPYGAAIGDTVSECRRGAACGISPKSHSAVTMQSMRPDVGTIDVCRGPRDIMYQTLYGDNSQMDMTSATPGDVCEYIGLNGYRYKMPCQY